MLACEGRDGLAVEDVQGHAERGRVDARVARRRDDRIDLGVGCDGLDECVLTGAGTEDEDLHGGQPIGSSGRPGESMRS